MTTTAPSLSTNNTQFDEEEAAAARRKAAWQLKAARIKARQDKNKRLETVVENKALNDDGTTKLWVEGFDPQKQRREQTEYADQYRADYHDFGFNKPSNQSGSAASSNNGDCLDDSNRSIPDNCSYASSIADGSEIGELPPTKIQSRNRRGRLFKGPKSISERSVVNEMDRTSTIMPPTEACTDSDFTSNVDVPTLKKTHFARYKTTTNLPIYPHRATLINSINTYSVVIIQGLTGCGKTTQVPAYILEDAILDRSLPKAPVIYVTQPRRIAAKSIAKRVADEHDWVLGEVVGYQVGLERCTSSNTILTFCTSGVLLQKLINEKSLSNYSHIIIDEAHERDADTDLLMMMIRTLMRKEKSFFRLIVMSATIDVGKLKDYFTFKTTFGHNAVTVPSICRIKNEDKIWQNELQIIYMDMLSQNFRIHEHIPDFQLDQPEIFEDCLNAAVKIIVDVIPNVDTFNRNTQTVLVFLPGLAEITKLHRLLDATKAALDIIPIHSSLASVDQARIFLPSERGYRKVVLATNIAESSITVRDAGFIVDFCLTKILKKDELTKFPMLKLDWCTTDKLGQRAGRTGRCCPGKVFRLITSDFFKRLPPYAEAELLVAPLELSILKIKTFDMGEVKALLAVVLDPPPLNEIKTAVLELKQIGAMTAHYKGELSDEDGDLTELGQVIARLPIDVHLSKLIVIASLLDCLEDAIVVAASLSSNRNVVRQLYENPTESFLNKLSWARESQSDLFVSIAVYKQYIYDKEILEKNSAYLERSCANKNLDERKLEEITAIRQDLIFRLEQMNIKILDQPNRIRDRDEDEIMLKVAFCAAFYPNYFLNLELDPKMVERDLCGFEPTKTVVLHGFPVNSVPLYRTQVLDQILNREYFKDIQPGQLEFYADQSRALLVINEDTSLTRDEREELSYERGQATISGALDKSFHVGGIVQGKKFLFSLLKSSEQLPFIVTEYSSLAAHERMQYYRNARERIKIPRLVPSLLKLVNGEADNSHLTVESDEEFSRNLQEKYYTEVTFNEEQDFEDICLLNSRLQQKVWPTRAKLTRSLASSSSNSIASMTKTTPNNNSNNVDPVASTSTNVDQPDSSSPASSISNQPTVTIELENLTDEDLPPPPVFGEPRSLRGPDSPVLMKFMAVLNKSKGYNVDICTTSINSLLLDADYKKAKRQLLVAASVSQAQRTGRLIARDTTLMPDIIGLPTIMSLLFARNYRLIYNEKLKCYSGAIFSLGWDEDGRPLRKEFEVELEFDTHIVQDDLDLINRARQNVSSLIEFIDINNPGAPRGELQRELRLIILSLMKRRRYPLKPVDLNMIDWTEGNFIKDCHNQVDDYQSPINNSSTSPRNHHPSATGDDPANSPTRTAPTTSKRIKFLPPLNTTRTVRELDLMETLRNNLDQLHRIERGEESMPIGGIQCLLCGSSIGHLYIFRTKLIDHCCSEHHIKLYEQFEKSEERARIRFEEALSSHE